MAEPPASNASPLIVLARAGHLRLLRELYGTIMDALVHAGLFLAPDLREQALRLVGE